MKMARASEQDMEVANEVAQFIEDLLKGYMPECISKADDGYEYFMIEEPDDCQRALRKLLEIGARCSGLRSGCRCYSGRTGSSIPTTIAWRSTRRSPACSTIWRQHREGHDLLPHQRPASISVHLPPL